MANATLSLGGPGSSGDERVYMGAEAAHFMRSIIFRAEVGTLFGNGNGWGNPAVQDAGVEGGQNGDWELRKTYRISNFRPFTQDGIIQKGNNDCVYTNLDLLAEAYGITFHIPVAKLRVHLFDLGSLTGGPNFSNIPELARMSGFESEVLWETENSIPNIKDNYEWRVYKHISKNQSVMIVQELEEGGFHARLIVGVDYYMSKDRKSSRFVLHEYDPGQGIIEKLPADFFTTSAQRAWKLYIIYKKK